MNTTGSAARRALAGIALAAASALALTACAGGTTETASTEGSVTDLTVQIAPIHYETAYIAQREGFFEQAGLNVEIVPGADPAANLAQAVSGDVDITTVSWGAMTTSVSTGMPVSVVAGNGVVSDTVDTSGILVPADSDIQTVLDLEGKTVAVVGVRTGSDIPVLQAVQEAGGDWKSLNLIAIPYAGMQTALEQGTVDAALPADQFYQQMVESDAGFRVVSNPVREFQAGMPVTLWVASDEWLAANPDTAEKFVEAMSMAVDFYSDPVNEHALAEIVAEVKQIPIEEALAVTHSPMQVEVDVQRAQDLSDDYLEFEIITTEVKAEDILWENAPRL